MLFNKGDWDLDKCDKVITDVTNYCATGDGMCMMIRKDMINDGYGFVMNSGGLGDALDESICKYCRKVIMGWVAYLSMNLVNIGIKADK